MMDDAKQQPGMDDESWMDEMGWGEDSPADPAPVAAASPMPGLSGAPVTTSEGEGRKDAPCGPEATTQPAAPDWAAIAEALRGIRWREPKTAWRQVVELVGLPKLVGGGALAVLVLALFLLPGGERGDLSDSSTVMGWMLNLGVVLALLYVAMAALKRVTSGAVSQRGTLLEVLDSKTLGPNRGVYVVRAGGKRLVLGVTHNQITPLAELDADDDAPEAAGSTSEG